MALQVFGGPLGENTSNNQTSLVELRSRDTVQAQTIGNGVEIHPRYRASPG